MRAWIAITLVAVICFPGCATPPEKPNQVSTAREHSDEFFHPSSRQPQVPPVAPSVPNPEAPGSPKDYLVATGRGELTKGSLVCERVADTVARAALARQIRVYIEETFTDRQRESSNGASQQDIEVVVKEISSELLQDVQIIARTVDEKTMTCASTAVMPKSRITQKAMTSPTATPLSP